MRHISSVGVAEKVETEAGRERSGVQSIERAFSILNQISQHQGIGLAELSKKVGLHNSPRKGSGWPFPYVTTVGAQRRLRKEQTAKPQLTEPLYS